MTSSYYSPR